MVVWKAHVLVVKLDIDGVVVKVVSSERLTVEKMDEP